MLGSGYNLPAETGKVAFVSAVPADKPMNHWTATEIVAAIEAGRTTCEAVTRACLDRIAEREAEVGAWAYCDAAAAIAAAQAFDRSGRRGPLAGVPFGVKDIIDTFDMPTEWGTPIHQGRRPERDAACVALSRKAGGMLLGKTVTTEFANLHPGKTRNPHDLTRTPAGSSSGSAAAVADFMVPIAIGTQTTGSTIRPASFCGVFGYRPTWGEHRMHGVMEASGSLDTLGILARSVEDIALYRDVLLGIPPQPIPELSGPPKVALCRSHLWDQFEPSTRDLIEDAATRLARAGAKVTEFKLPSDFAALNDAHRWISSFEFARTFAFEIENHWDEISDTLRGGRLHDGIHGDFDRYIAAKELAQACRDRLDHMWGDVDGLLTPAAFGEAPVGMPAFAGVPLFQLWTILHVPQISLPVFKGPAGMPIGAMLISKRHDDRKLFACAQWAWRKLT
jgi:amidase